MHTVEIPRSDWSQALSDGADAGNPENCGACAASPAMTSAASGNRREALSQWARRMRSPAIA